MQNFQKWVERELAPKFALQKPLMSPVLVPVAIMPARKPFISRRQSYRNAAFVPAF